MNQAHIVLIDTHGAIIDYRVDAETLASIFTQLQATGERMTFPVIRSEYLKVETPKPVAPVAEPEPEVPDVTPKYVGSYWRVFHGLVAGWLEVEFDSKPIPYVRQELKDNGYRWNPRAERWYGPEDRLPVWLAGAEDIKDPEPVEVVEPEVVDPLDDIPTIGGSGSRCKPVTFDQPVSTLPDPGAVVRLTGGFDEPSIARGDSWTDSIVEDSGDEPSADDDAAFLASLNDLFKGS